MDRAASLLRKGTQRGPDGPDLKSDTYVISPNTWCSGYENTFSIGAGKKNRRPYSMARGHPLVGSHLPSDDLSLMAIYCDEDDCYDLLGNQESLLQAVIEIVVTQIKRSGIQKAVCEIANAYEGTDFLIADSERRGTREQYDYAIAHPEEVFYNAARYYHAYYGHKTVRNLHHWIPCCPCGSSFSSLCISISKSVDKAVDMVKKTPAYKNRLWALELERTGGVINVFWQEMEEELSKELELQIKGAEKPSIWELIGVRFVLLPYTIGKDYLSILCSSRYYYGMDFGSGDTRVSLNLVPELLLCVCLSDESTKEDLLQRRLWEKSNLEKYLAELRKDSKRRR
ncbi:Chaperone protein dnaJ 50 [Vitis vinifera]|uniref:Chaperone protein dnaJ 50 n=1 Tax=Vitis vinifera TaxID=29760 RepID=A0A438EDP6_VITVI|nr:Chaperone protein dnaJ 50 [Vitis vinifera]